MTKPSDPNLHRPKKRAPRPAKPPASPAMESPVPHRDREGGVNQDGEGLEKLEAVGSETGAGLTFSENAKKGRGSTGESHGAEDSPEPAPRGRRKVPQGVDDSMAVPESDRVAGLAEDGPALGEVIAPGGWRRVVSKSDPGVGFYRFRLDELPMSIGGRTRADALGAVVEVFAENLTKARRMLALMSRGPFRSLQGGGVATVPESPEVWPFAHRPTRLCKRARKARGE